MSRSCLRGPPLTDKWCHDLADRPPIHRSLTPERWHSLTLFEQLGNIGSEVGRAIRAKVASNPDRMWSALERALELFDLTVSDPSLRHRLKEICRAREVVLDYLVGGNVYASSAEDLDRYFMAYAWAARRLVGVAAAP